MSKTPTVVHDGTHLPHGTMQCTHCFQTERATLPMPVQEFVRLAERFGRDHAACRPLPALSVRQPWAWAILHAGKPVENRTWPTRFRGRLLIHAGKTFDREGYEWIALNAERLGIPVGALPGPKGFPMGGVVGAVTVTDCVEGGAGDPAEGSPWFFGPFGFTLDDPTAYELVPCRGALGFFRPEVASV